MNKLQYYILVLALVLLAVVTSFCAYSGDTVQTVVETGYTRSLESFQSTYIGV